MKPVTFRVSISNVQLAPNVSSVVMVFSDEHVKTIKLSRTSLAPVSFQWTTDYPDSLHSKFLTVKSSLGAEDEKLSIYDLATGPVRQEWPSCVFDCAVDQVCSRVVELQLHGEGKSFDTCHIVLPGYSPLKASSHPHLDGQFQARLPPTLTASGIVGGVAVFCGKGSLSVLRLKLLLGVEDPVRVQVPLIKFGKIPPLSDSGKATFDCALTNGPTFVQMPKGVNSQKGVISCGLVANYPLPLPKSWQCPKVAPVFDPDVDCSCTPPFDLCLSCAMFASLVVDHAKIRSDVMPIPMPSSAQRLKLLAEYWDSKMYEIRRRNALLVSSIDTDLVDHFPKAINLDEPFPSPEVRLILSRLKSLREEREGPKTAVGHYQAAKSEILTEWGRVELASMKIRKS